MDTGGFSTQRCDGIYIRKNGNLCSQHAANFSLFFADSDVKKKKNFFATLKTYLLTASLEENTIYCLKLRSMGGNLDVLRLEYDLRIDVLSEVTTKFLSSSCTESRIFLDASAREVFSWMTFQTFLHMNFKIFNL